jgi:radical S-adenosyl methionine domain-containing protein 2
MKPHVINFHITDKCNYHCKYCFAKFHQQDLPLEDAKRVIDAAHNYFAANGIENGRINIAGGEPMLYPHLEEIITYIRSRGMLVSIITNGSRLTADFCERMADLLDMVGISIDAANHEGNERVGRCCCGATPDFAELKKAFDILRQSGVRIKINTVVSKLNLNEDMSPVYEMLRPNKVKFVCVHKVENINGNMGDLVPTAEEYISFVMRNGNIKNCRVVLEGPGYMQNAYFMINPQGEVFLNDRGVERKYGSCLTESLDQILSRTPLNRDAYFERYQ